MSQATDRLNDLWVKELMINPKSNPQFENFYKEDLVRLCKVAKEIIKSYQGEIQMLKGEPNEKDNNCVVNDHINSNNTAS